MVRYVFRGGGGGRAVAMLKCVGIYQLLNGDLVVVGTCLVVFLRGGGGD